MPIKVLQITAAYKPAYIYGGPTMSVSKLCEALTFNEINDDIEVFTTTANGKTELVIVPNLAVKVDGVTVTYFERITKDHTHFSPALLKGLKKVILNQKTNQTSLVIHIHAWWNLVSLLSCSLAKWYKVPVLLSPRGMLTNYTSGNRNAGFKSLIHTLMGKRLLKYCHVHVTSEKEKEDVLSIINPKSITVIPNLVSFPSIDMATKLHLPSSSAFKLIFLSRIEEKKGLPLLFVALAELSFDWSLTIAGSGEESYVNDLKFKTKNLKIDSRINWIGQVKNEDKFKLLAEHDLLVLTSYNENFANVVIESLSVGTAVLLSNEVGLADYVEEKQLGWVTDLTPKEISNKIIVAHIAENKRKSIRENAPQIITDDFDSKNLIQKYITLYSKIAHGRL